MADQFKILQVQLQQTTANSAAGTSGFINVKLYVWNIEIAIKIMIKKNDT